MHGGEQEPEKVEHSVSIADLRSPEVLPPHSHKPRHLVRDRDTVYGRDLRRRARCIGIDAIGAPVRSPHPSAVVERVIGTLRRECLDHIIVLDEQHLGSVLREFVAYYNLPVYRQATATSGSPAARWNEWN